jgi:ankyrin repeat protein
MMEFLLDSGADVNSRHTLLGTPICVAALRGHAKAVEVLFKYKAGLRLTHNGAIGSAMHCACFSGDMAILKMLLENGGDLKQSSTISILAFYDMAKEDFTPSWSAFWSRKYGVRQIKCTPVLLAAERCHFDLLDLCWIELGKTRPESIPITSMYSLENPRWGYVAEETAKSRYSPSIGTTVSIEASTNSTWSSFGFPRTASTHIRSTLLMWAAASLKLDLISYLLNHGARLGSQDAFERTALHYVALPFEGAAFQNIEGCVKRLAQERMSEPAASQLLSLIIHPDHPTLDPHVTHIYGDKLQARYIHVILSHTYVSDVPDAICKALCVASRHTINARCAFDALCEHSSIRFNCPNELLWYIVDKHEPSETLVSSLLNHGAGPNFAFTAFGNPKKDTTMHIAVKTRKSKAIVALLLKHGADPDVMNRNGETPRTCAKALHSEYMTELFDRSQASRPWFPIQLALPSLLFGPEQGSSRSSTRETIHWNAFAFVPHLICAHVMTKEINVSQQTRWHHYAGSVAVRIIIIFLAVDLDIDHLERVNLPLFLLALEWW